ncbi:MAG: EamA family transporter [Opitutaceae bacterium]
MAYLLAVSFLWAFSFGLIKGQLAGVDPVAVAAIRMALSVLVFIPLLRLRGIPAALMLRLAIIGAVQFGVMYMLYLSSYRFLQAYEVALFTVFTPLYIFLIDAIMERAWHPRFLAAALLAAVGAAIVLDTASMTRAHWAGFLLIQGTNLCFAAGQLAWRRAHDSLKAIATDGRLFALPYLGALLVCCLVSLFTTDWRTFNLSGTQMAAIAYLGVIPSGLCFFWWNIGAERVNAGTLAAMNNVKMPLAVLLALTLFHEKADLARLIIGGAIIAAGIWVAEIGRERKGV